MSQGLEKEFVNAGVQSPSEFEVASDDLATQSVLRRTVLAESPKSRVDSIVQTQDSACELRPLGNKSQKTLIIALESCGHGRETSQDLNCKDLRKIKNKGKGMENKPSESGATRTMSDLERKKLEAELKATEQIAKIKQSVIEKRLELELASLQDNYNPNLRPLQSPKTDLKILENCLERNENLTEIEERGPTYRTTLVPPPVSAAHTPPLPTPPPQAVRPPPPPQAVRPPFLPPFAPPTMPLNQCPRDFPKMKSPKNESDFLIKNEIKGLKLSPLSTGSSEQKYARPVNLGRNITLPERGRFMQMIEKPKYPTASQVEQNPFKMPMEDAKFVQSPQISVTEAYYANRIPERNANLQEDPQEPGCSPGMAGESKTLSIWKALKSKVKKKMKKPPPPWQ